MFHICIKHGLAWFRQPSGTHTLIIGYSLGANNAVLVANSVSHVDSIIALQRSMFMFMSNPIVTGDVGRWIVETAGSDGINYAVHSLCTSASLPEKTQTKNIIVRPIGPDRAALGQSFED